MVLYVFSRDSKLDREKLPLVCLVSLIACRRVDLETRRSAPRSCEQRWTSLRNPYRPQWFKIQTNRLFFIIAYASALAAFESVLLFSIHPSRTCIMADKVRVRCEFLDGSVSLLYALRRAFWFAGVHFPSRRWCAGPCIHRRCRVASLAACCISIVFSITVILYSFDGTYDSIQDRIRQDEPDARFAY